MSYINIYFKNSSKKVFIIKMIYLFKNGIFIISILGML